MGESISQVVGDVSFDRSIWDGSGLGESLYRRGSTGMLLRAIDRLSEPELLSAALAPCGPLASAKSPGL